MLSPCLFLSIFVSVSLSVCFPLLHLLNPLHSRAHTHDCARASLTYADQRHGLKVDHVASLYKAVLEPCAAGAHAHSVGLRVFLRWIRSEVRSSTNTPRLHFNPHSSSADLLALAVKYRHRPGGAASASAIQTVLEG